MRAPGQEHCHEHGEKRDEGRGRREGAPPAGGGRQERACGGEPATAAPSGEVVGDRGDEGAGDRHRKRERHVGESRQESRATTGQLGGKRTGDRGEQRAHDVRTRPREGKRAHAARKHHELVGNSLHAGILSGTLQPSPVTSVTPLPPPS